MFRIPIDVISKKKQTIRPGFMLSVTELPFDTLTLVSRLTFKASVGYQARDPTCTSVQQLQQLTYVLCT